MATKLRKTLITSLSMFLNQLCPPGSLLMHLPRLKNNFKSREFSRTNIVKITTIFMHAFCKKINLTTLFFSTFLFFRMAAEKSEIMNCEEISGESSVCFFYNFWCFKWLKVGLLWAA